VPIYEFACRECGHNFELRRSMAQRLEPAACAACGAPRAALKLSAFAVAGGSAGSRASSAADLPRPPAGGCGMGACGCGH
jgi:putative FmdB family regulatory protein